MLTIDGHTIGPDDIYVSGYPGIVSSRYGDVAAHGVHTGQGWHIVALNAGDGPAIVTWQGDFGTVPPRREIGTYGVVRLGAPLLVRDDARERLEWSLAGFDLDGPRFAAVAPDDVYPNTGQKGSPRVTWGACKPAVSALWGHQGALDSLRAWADKQLTHRAVHEVEPYDNGPGGVSLTGKWRTYDTQHMELDKLAAFAALTGDPGAWISLRWHAEAAIAEGSRIVTMGEDNPRAWGWVLWALGTWDAMTMGHDERAMATAQYMADYLDTVCSTDPLFPYVTLNQASAAQADHGFCRVSTWMTARVGLGLLRCGLTHRPCFDAAVESMRYAHAASVMGLGSHVEDYDDGRAKHTTHPFGSYSTDASVWLFSWLTGDDTLRDHISEVHRRADCFRQADRNCKHWITHVVGEELGYR